MPSLESINELLSEAANKLDQAAIEIRDVPLDPAKDHIIRIGEALTNIFEIQLLIYKARPDLKPAHLNKPSIQPNNNRELGGALLEAGDLAEAGKINEAIVVLEDFIKNNPTSQLCGIAAAEIERYKKHGT